MAKHPTKYHAGNHGLGFADLVTVLARCERVQPDPRRADERAHLSWGSDWRGSYRIDFDLGGAEGEPIIYIVTAVKLT